MKRLKSILLALAATVVIPLALTGCEEKKQDAEPAKEEVKKSEHPELPTEKKAEHPEHPK